jgi:hypothetical protein
MGWKLDARRRQIHANGRAMVLRRNGIADLVICGVDRAYQPDELTGGLQTGDVRIEALNDEIAAAAWPVPPMRPDRILVDGKTLAIQGAHPVHEGPVLIGWSLWAR